MGIGGVVGRGGGGFNNCSPGFLTLFLLFRDMEKTSRNIDFPCISVSCVWIDVTSKLSVCQG